MDEVTEAVQVVVDQIPTLVVGGRLEHVDCIGFFIERRKFLVEFLFEVSPVVEAEKAIGGEGLRDSFFRPAGEAGVSL